MTDTLSRVEDLPELDLDAFRTDPEATLDALRPHRMVRSVRGVEVIGYDLAYELLADQRLRPMTASASSHVSSPAIAEFVHQGVFLFMEPERHRRIRKVFARAFAARKVLESRELITATAHSLVDRMADEPTSDLVADYTQRFASEVLCRVLGFPTEDIPEFVDAALDLRHLVYVPVEPHVEAIERALATLQAYAIDLLAERRRDPQPDFLSTLVEAENESLSTEEVVWGTVNLLLAGVDTTNFQIALTLQHLIENAVWDEVGASAELRDAAIEEATRLTPISTMLGRVVVDSLVIDGVELSAGQDIRISVVGAGRDPARFDDPHSFRLDRQPPYFPAAFGNGIHVCIGKNLAWQELRTAVETITARLTDVRLVEPPVMHAWTDAFYGPEALRVAYRTR